MRAGSTLLPRSLHFEIPDNSAGVVTYRGGFSDVLKREYRGQEVAVKALWVYGDNRWQEVTNVGHPCASVHFTCWELNVTRSEVPQGGHYLDSSSTSKRVTTVGDDDRKSIRYGV